MKGRDKAFPSVAKKSVDHNLDRLSVRLGIRQFALSSRFQQQSHFLLGRFVLLLLAKFRGIVSTMIFLH